MDRNSRQLARSERLANNSPYKRPQQQQQQMVKHQPGGDQSKSPVSSFPSLRSIYSFVTAPFSRQPLLPQTNQDLPIEEDQKSQSGSEDGWNGTPPAGMEGQDMFSIAAAGGRQGGDFEKRAIENRDEGAISIDSSRKATVSESFLPLYNTDQSHRDLPESSTAHLQRYQTPAHGASSSSAKRSLQSTSALNSSTSKPLPSFLPTAQTAKTPQSAASIAFTAFVDAKKGQTMSPEDLRVMRTLMENMEAEQRGVVPAAKTGGWSAGNANSPRPVKSLANGLQTPGVAPSTPNGLVDSVRGTNGALFSVGSPARRSEAGSAGGDSPASRRIRYLGPGMSPRRMQNKSRASDRPAFATDVAEESEPKRQKVDTAVIDTPQKPENQSTSTSTSASPMQVDTPAPSPPKSRALEKAKGTMTPSRPSPLGQSTVTTSSPREDDSVAQGKKRAADIVKELMQEEIGSLESLSKRDYMVINPYDVGTPGSTSQRSEASSSLSKSISRTATPKKSILRSSLRSSTSTPLSGAAAKLEAHKPGRKLTTLELLEGKKPWVGPIVDETMRSQTPSPARDAIEVDESMDDSPEPSPAKESEPLPRAQPISAPSRPFPKMPDEFKAPSFKAPDVSSPARPMPSFVPSPSPSKPSPASFKPSRSATEAPMPKFSLAPPKVSEPLPEIENSTLASISRSAKPSVKSEQSDAQQQALQRPAASLPAFTFTLSSPLSKISEAVKSAALALPLQQYTFSLTETTKPSTSSKVAPQWTCDTCMLKNPDSAKEKCTICESPRPSSSATASKAAPVSAQPAGAEWTCEMCMLKNPDSAKAKCNICEAPRPKPSFAAAAPAPPQPAGADWTCDMCMLKNPDSAKAKCTICEAPRPASSNSSKPANGFGQSAPAPAAAPTRKPGPWTCSLCMLQNPETATEKCQICEAKRP